MVLTFTGSISAASAERREIGLILWAALGCNVAWGIVDAFMYLMSLMMERGNAATALRKVQRSPDIAGASSTIKEYLPPVVAEVITERQLEEIQLELKQVPEPPEAIPVSGRDIRAAIQIFFLVVLSTFPCTLPFLLIKTPLHAMRVSNAIALTLLFITGYQLGRQTGYNKWLLGVVVAVLGIVLVLLTIALGG
jgi:VIT1/CCC1 family predicted Fe2+/Mn2+ transporter